MKKYFLFFLMILGTVVSAVENISIYLSREATVVEYNASMELKKALKKIFDLNVPIVRNSPEKSLFWVGQSQASAKALKIKNFSSLKPDEIILKNIDGKMLILGDRPRGSVYAVYEFLEKAYGVRFWTAKDEYWPRHQKFFLPEINHRYAPVFQRRYLYYDLARNDSFALKVRSNRYNSGAQWGGKEDIIGFVHTFGYFVPGKVHFKKHPEWFALRGKKRVPDCQLCLTNKEMRKFFVEAVLKKLRSTPAPSVVSVSQNDGLMTPCQCTKCEEFIRKHGNISDLYMDMVNEVADAVAKEFPGVWVETLAYAFTLPTPKTIIPRKNVLIRFCPGKSNAAQPVSHPANAAQGNVFKVWKKYGNPLAVWTYETDFKRFYLPFPNWRGLTQDLRFYAENGVVDVFQQGSYAGSAADLSDLRVWMLGKLQWNPYLDPRKLIEEFAKGFYGKAAPYILEYIKHMTLTAKPGTNKLLLFHLDRAALLKAREILLAGEKAVADDPVLRLRMKHAAITVNLGLLHLSDVWSDPPASLAGIKWQTLLEEQIKLLKDAKITRLAESRFTPDMLRPNIRLIQAWEKGAPPVPGYAPGTRWKRVSAAVCRRFGRYKIVNDPAAPGGAGEVLEVECTHGTWTSQLWNPPLGTWDVYVELQCSGKNPQGKTASFGCYDVEQKTGIAAGSVNAEKITAPGYHPVRIGTLTPDNNQYIYCAPVPNKSVERLRIASYLFVEVKK
ncbi:MAG: DUF4838 domain-containing protein [Lentisphaeria bacterium]|nr:DUF4838 domain-containing protein [Lentisphaeria bacterium]